MTVRPGDIQCYRVTFFLLTVKTTVTVTIPMDEALVRALKEIASREDRSLAAQIRVMLSQAIEKEGKK